MSSHITNFTADSAFCFVVLCAMAQLTAVATVGCQEISFTSPQVSLWTTIFLCMWSKPSSSCLKRSCPEYPLRQQLESEKLERRAWLRTKNTHKSYVQCPQCALKVKHGKTCNMGNEGKTLSFAQGSAKRRRFRTYFKRSPPVANWQNKSFRHGMQYSAHVGHVSSCLSDLCRLSMTTCDMKCSSCISGLHDQSNLWWSFHHLNEKTFEAETHHGLVV